MNNALLDCSGSLTSCIWLCMISPELYMLWCCQWNPCIKCIGPTADIIPLLRFSWYQQLYYTVDNSDFPSDTREKKVHFIGICEHVGHTLAFKVLTDDTSKIINLSNVRSAGIPLEYNLRLDPLYRESEHAIKSKSD